MRVFISFDMEGVAGIVDWSQCRPPGQPYEEGRRLLLGEVNAAIDGALAAGATDIICNDSHGAMNNLDPAALHGRAAYVAGRHKPLYMMQGMDSSVDAVFLIGYHGSISGEGSVLSHTYNPSVISRVALNGTECGESGINALVALACQAPVALVTGDQHTIAQGEPFLKGAGQVIVKDSITRFAAAQVHPLEARERIAAGAEDALNRLASIPLPSITLPARLEVEMQTADMAEVASWAKGVERDGTRSVVIEGDDPLQAFRSFVALTYITRQAEGRSLALSRLGRCRPSGRCPGCACCRPPGHAAAGTCPASGTRQPGWPGRPRRPRRLPRRGRPRSAGSTRRRSPRSRPSRLVS
jgi:D-amino peptidase